MPEQAAPHPTPHPDVAGYVLGVLEEDEAAAFETHLEACEACRVEIEELSGLPELLAVASPPVEVPPGLRDRTFEAVEREARSQGDRRQLRRRLVAIAAVAVLVLGAAGVLATQLDDERPEGTEIVLIAAEAGGSGRGVAHVRTEGRTRIVDLQVEDLPQPPPGTFYQGWFVGPGDSPQNPNRVPIATFEVDDDGDARVRVETAADPERYPGIGITLEPDNGNPAREGPKALVTKPPTG